jgi:hypothetical protein
MQDGKQGEATADECAAPEEGKQAACAFVASMLPAAEHVLVDDPQRVVARIAKYTEKRVAPIVVGAMLFLDVVLLGNFLGFMAWRISRSFEFRTRFIKTRTFDHIVENHSEEKLHPYVFPIDHLARGYRRMLEVLEVAGPATAFALTVCALLVAFQPSVFVEGDRTRFADALSMAMNATFAGLVLRVLAFSTDRLFEQVLRSGGKNFGVDPTGNVYSKQEATIDSKPEATVDPKPAATIDSKPGATVDPERAAQKGAAPQGQANASAEEPVDQGAP